MKKLLFIFFIILSSCGQDLKPDFYLNEIGFKLKDDFQIIQSNSSIAIGASNLDFELKISESDYLNFKKKIQTSPKYNIIDDNELAPTAYTNGFFSEKDTVTWSRDSLFVYEIYSTEYKKGYEVYRISLKENNTLVFQYNED